MAIPVRHGPCSHDCTITGHFAVMLDLPVTFYTRHAGGYRFLFRWNSVYKARLGLLPRNGTAADVIWCELERCFVFHVANAFHADGGAIVVDLIVYDTMFAAAAEGPMARAWMRSAGWTDGCSTTPQEFSSIDERRTGQAYHYLYTVAVPPDADPQLVGAIRIYKHGQWPAAGP